MTGLLHGIPKLVLTWSMIDVLSVTQFADVIEAFGEHRSNRAAHTGGEARSGNRSQTGPANIGGIAWCRSCRS
jgi:hypothetical protein